MSIPKFRNTARLVKYVKKIGNYERLPREIEQVFFTTKKETPEFVAENLAFYSNYVGKLEPEFERILKGSNNAILQYARVLHNRMNCRISEELQDNLKGDSSNLYSLALLYDSRLPAHLEDSIDQPFFALKYATDVLRGRLPKHMEDVFFKDTRMASEYAFDVIRGFSSVRLPDHLHSFMIMESCRDPDNRYIKRYIEASESDPNKMGNKVRN